MSKPYSFRTQPWSAFDRESYSIINDDFFYSKPFTLKASLKSDKGNVNLKGSYDKKEVKQEVKVWFPHSNGKTIYFRQTPKQVKVHLDNGMKPIYGYDFNLYGSAQSSKSMTNLVLKVGAICFWTNAEFDNRMRWALKTNNEPEIHIGHKFYYNYKKFKFSILKVFNWTQFAMFHNALSICYKQDEKKEMFFRASNKTVRNMHRVDYGNLDTLFTDFAIDYVQRFEKDRTIAAEVNFTKKSLSGISLLLHSYIKGNRAEWVKFRVSMGNQYSAAMSYQRKISDYGKLSIGCQIKPEEKSLIASRFGVQLDLNL